MKESLSTNCFRFYSLINTLIASNGGCDFEALPSLSFVFGEEKYTLQPEDYLIRDDSGQECTVGLFPVDIEPPKGPLFILGTSFFKRYYTIFDIENNRVGFSKLCSKLDDTEESEEYYQKLEDSLNEDFNPRGYHRLGQWRRLA